MTDVPAPNVNRMHLKTAGDRAEVERACLEGGFLGIGWGYRWRSEPAPPTITWQKYITWAESQWPGRDTGNLWRFHDAGGLVWTRTADGVYYLAQFVGGWEYRRDDRHDTLDLNNVRRARIEQIGSENEVPGAIVRRFSRQGQAFCAVHDDSAARYSALLWARRTGEPYHWTPSIDEVLSTLLFPVRRAGPRRRLPAGRTGLVAVPVTAKRQHRSLRIRPAQLGHRRQPRRASQDRRVADQPGRAGAGERSPRLGDL